MMLLLALVACNSGGKPDSESPDTDPTDTDPPTDTDTDTDPPTDTDTTPPAPSETDDDGDGYSEAQGDCDDGNTQVKPAYLWERCGNAVDDDCNGTVDDGCGAGVAYVWSLQEITTGEGGSFAGGRRGGEYRNAADSLLCAVYGAQQLVGPAPDGCPDCVWSFEVETGWGAMEGAFCSALSTAELWVDFEQYEEPTGTYAFGFALSGYNPAGEPIDETIWNWSVEHGSWYPLPYNIDRYDWHFVYTDPHRYGWGGYLGYQFEYTAPP